MHHFLWLNETSILCSLSMNDQSFLCLLILDAIKDPIQGQVILRYIHASNFI